MHSPDDEDALWHPLCEVDPAELTDDFDEMAAFAEFYRYTPEQFWDLDMDDYEALRRRMDARAKDQQE
jgi:hypothetical protein